MITSYKLPSPALILLSVVMGAFIGLMAANYWLAYRLGLPFESITPLFWFDAPETLRHLYGAAFAEAAKVGLASLAATFIACLVLAIQPDRQSPHGDARWATRREIAEAGLLQDAGVILGKLGSPKSRAPFIRTVEDGYSNTLLVAPPGAGKGVGVVIPTLLTWPGSAVVLDVKGENLAITAGQRQSMGDTVFVFSPYDPDGKTHRFNPLEPIRAIHDADRRFSEIRRLATHLLTSKGKADEPFIEGARELFTAAAFVAVEGDEPTLGHVLRLLAPTHEAGMEGDKADVGQAMANRLRSLADQATHPSAQTTFLQYSASDAKTIGTFLSVLKSAGLGAWADPAIDRATVANDIDLTRLRSEPQTIYIVIAPNDMEALAPVARLFFQSVTAALQSKLPDKDEPLPVLLLLDEFKSLGRMDTILNAATVLRGYGGRMLFVVQGIPNIEEVYGRAGAEGLMNACQLHAYMSINDPRTKAMLSRSLGTFEITTEQESTSRTLGKQGLSRTQTQQRSATRLLSEDAINRLGADTILLIPQNARPVRARKVRYFEDRVLRKLAGREWVFEDSAGATVEIEQMTAPATTSTMLSSSLLPSKSALLAAAEFINSMRDHRAVT